MGNETLKNLMLWHYMGKDLTCKQVPVMAILKEFRTLAGIRGRSAHRGTAPPKYNYLVKVELEDLKEQEEQKEQE